MVACRSAGVSEGGSSSMPSWLSVLVRSISPGSDVQSDQRAQQALSHGGHVELLVGLAPFGQHRPFTTAHDRP